jgi:hypothetical protein
MRPFTIPLGAAAIVVAMTACQAATEGAEKPPDATSRATELPVARLAIDALSAELGIPKDRIEVESVTAVDWPDGSLGCPKPGMGYLSVITPGHRIALRADGTTYAVHEAGGRAIVCVQASKAPDPASGSNQLQFARQYQLARQDLASRLNVPESAIRLSGATPAVWDDASLGCPEPGVQYAQVETTGWILVLKQGGREFKYHADAQHALPCPPISAE